MKNIKVVVFDLYNTLVEIKEPNNFFLNLYRSSHNGFGLDISAYTYLLMTKELDNLFELLPSEFKELYTERKEELEKELNSVVIYKEVYNVLEELSKNYRLFLISNLASPYKKPIFDNNLNKYFDDMIFSCDYGCLKPEQKIFKEVETLTANTPDEILMVGDSYKSDIVGAKQMAWNYLKVNRKSEVKEVFEISDLGEITSQIGIK
ncbi:HAD family hydrolase [Chondrinema litorale]|uniref:HAD family hydrolase n=1 Tax=Chondrinema litorale TaxID=2994555 RepID=UPI002543CB1F|nr:HAD family hydrolase [Chondrinema litorale]UZR97744.1 HAD family hydrolase [Chondrinema litorale]